jgi:ketosteroid isomerase-like protein
MKVQAATRSDTSSDEVLGAFHAYAAAFRALDPRAVAASFATPCLLLSPRGDVAASTSADVVKFYDGVMAEARRVGYASTELTLASRKIDRVTAAVIGSGAWLAADGRVLMRFEVTYLFRKVEGAWKIRVSEVRERPSEALPS